jgi:hypothetical protein
MPTDLLYNGGIGTYVKAQSESNAEVGDSANAAVRVNANELRARVVGEGGNLGFTQLGRIEYAQAGGKVYTDAIDNSAGVDTSDHEVNIKIALQPLVASSAMTITNRNALLDALTDDVAALVLAHNRSQSRAISRDQARGQVRLGYRETMSDLEAIGTRPRPRRCPIATPCGARAAFSASPPRARGAAGLRQDHAARLGRRRQKTPPSGCCSGIFRRGCSNGAGHGPRPLRRELIATTLTNRIVDLMGATFFTRTMRERRVGAGHHTRVRDRCATGASTLAAAADGARPANEAAALHTAAALERAVRLLATYPASARSVERFQDGLAEVERAARRRARRRAPASPCSPPTRRHSAAEGCVRPGCGARRRARGGTASVAPDRRRGYWCRRDLRFCLAGTALDEVASEDH